MTDTPAAPPRKSLLTWWFAIPLYQRILGALILGAVVGYVWGEGATSLKIVGEVFIRLIRMLVAPLVFVIIATGVAELGDPKRLGGIGVKTISMYCLTVFLAVVVGLIMASLFQPGLGADFANVAPQAVGTPKSPAEIFIGIVPLNPIKALAEGETLAIIFFAVMIGAGVIVAGEAGKPVAMLLKSGTEVMLKLVGFVMETAPLGVFALIAVVMGTNGPETFINVARLAACVIAGSLVQTLIVHGGIVRLMAWLPVVPFFRGIIDAMLVGFSTASSSASLPVAIRVAEDNLGIKPPVTSTVLPLGATIGMDGTAMYVAMLTLFAVQAFGVQLEPAQYGLIAVTTTIVAMGVAPVPSGSLFILAAVLGSIGIGAEQTALIVGFILPFDRVLDMIRTVPNVTADLAVATAVGRWEKEIDLEVYKGRPPS